MTKKNIATSKLSLIVPGVLIFLFVLLAFYWSQVRPSVIRSKCANETDLAIKNKPQVGVDYFKLLTGKTGQTSNESTIVDNDGYQLCLHKNGL